MKKIVFLLLIIAVNKYCKGQNFQILQFKNSSDGIKSTNKAFSKPTNSSNFSSLQTTSSNNLDSIYLRFIDSFKKGTSIELVVFKKYFDTSEIKNAKKDSINLNLKDTNSYQFLAFLKKIPDNSFQKDKKLAYLKTLIDKDEPYYDNLESINAAISAIKIENTLNEFLTKLKQPKTFLIQNIKRYNIDTINYYFSGQSKVASFQNISIQNFTSSANISAELGTFYFGPLRLGVGGAFSLKSDSTVKANIQKIITNGGNLNLNFSLPLLFHRDRLDKLHYGVYAQSNYGINAGFDSTSKQTDFSENVLFQNQMGFNFHLDFGSNDSKARIFFNLPMYYVWGSKKTYEQLNISDYSILRAQVGASLGDLIQFKLSGSLWSSSKIVQATPYVLSFSFSPFNIQKN